MTDGAKSTLGLISIPQAARLLRCTEQWVRRLTRDGWIPKPTRGMVPLVGAVHGYIDFLKDEERRASKSAAASAVQQARADEIRLRIARESGKLIDLEDAEAAFADILSTWRSELDGLSKGVTRDLALRETIDQYIDGMVRRARAKFAAARENLAGETK